MTQTASLKKYIGRPYEKYNCFDLVKEFYKDQFDIELKNYYEGEIPNPSQVEVLITSNKGDFFRVEKPRFGDLVVLRIYGIECHLGVVITEHAFLHSTREVGSNIDRLYRWENMRAGFFRHRDLSDD